MSVQQYGREFPILLRLNNPRGHVELMETLGKGNYGYVYKGRLIKKNNELAAVKVVFLKEDEIKETLLEREILESCNHPNITKYMGCFLKGLDLWICMEFCGAGSVDAIYRTLKKPVSENVIASLLYGSLLGLDYLHNKVGLIHRDIKAGNLLLTMDGKLKLADFGVSAQLQTIGGRANTFIGTPYWMAPEVIACDPDSATAGKVSYNYKSDIWSLGITAIEIAEKNPPLSDIHPMQALHLIAKSDIGFAKPKSFSKPFVDFTMFCLNKNPAKRPSAAQCLEHAFMKQAAQLPREEILADIVKRVQIIKDKKKQGIEVTDEDESSPITMSTSSDQSTVSTSKVPDSNPTVSRARKLLTSFGVLQSSISSIPTAPVPTTTSFTALAVPSAEIKDGDSTLAASSFSDFPVIVNHVAEGDNSVLEPIALTSIQSDQCTAEFLDGQYILIGCEKGLFFLDITKPQQKNPIPIIHDIRFTQLQILHEYNVMIALSGRHNHIRQYSLASIRKLILYVEGNPVEMVADSNTSLPIQQVQIGLKPKDDYEYLKESNSRDESVLVSGWTNDFIKIPDTKESKSFSVELTETSAFLVTILYQGITLFRWAVDPYCKFMKIKSFWVPETPLFVSFSQDGLAPVDLFIGYTSELNRVAIHDSHVTEVGVHKEMKTRGMIKPRWQCMNQIPFSDSKLEEMLRETNRGTSVRKLAALAGPTLARAHFTMSERYFLGTYNKLTKVVDGKGYPMVGAGVAGWKDGVMWSEPPVTQILRPLQHVMSAGKNSMEIVEWKTASLKQRLTLDSSASFKILSSRHGFTLLAVEKKKKGFMVYWMRENSSAPRMPGELFKKIQQESTVSPPMEQQSLQRVLTSADVEKMAEDLESIQLSASSATVPPITSNPGGPFFDGETSSPSSNGGETPYSPPNPSPGVIRDDKLGQNSATEVISSKSELSGSAKNVPEHQFVETTQAQHFKRPDSRQPPPVSNSYPSLESRYQNELSYHQGQPQQFARSPPSNYQPPPQNYGPPPPNVSSHHPHTGTSQGVHQGIIPPSQNLYTSSNFDPRYQSRPQFYDPRGGPRSQPPAPLLFRPPPPPVDARTVQMIQQQQYHQQQLQYQQQQYQQTNLQHNRMQQQQPMQFRQPMQKRPSGEQSQLDPRNYQPPPPDSR